MSNDPSLDNKNPPNESAVPATDFLRRPLWYWPELAAAVGTPVAAGGSEVSGISIDSRTLNSGDLFIALSGDPGERFSPRRQAAGMAMSFCKSPMSGVRQGH